MLDLVGLLWQYGPTAVLVGVLVASNVWYIVRDNRKIAALELRVLSLEEYQRTVLTDLVLRSNATMERVERILDRLI